MPDEQKTQAPVIDPSIFSTDQATWNAFWSQASPETRQALQTQYPGWTMNRNMGMQASFTPGSAPAPVGTSESAPIPMTPEGTIDVAKAQEMYGDQAQRVIESVVSAEDRGKVAEFFSSQEAVDEFHRSNVQDPIEPDKWYPRDWYRQQDEQGNSLLSIMMENSGASEDDSIAALERLFEVGGLENVGRHFNQVQSTQYEAAIEPIVQQVMVDSGASYEDSKAAVEKMIELGTLEQHFEDVQQAKLEEALQPVAVQIMRDSGASFDESMDAALKLYEVGGVEGLEQHLEGVQEEKQRHAEAAPTPAPMSGEAIFAQMKASGEVPKGAVYGGIDETTGLLSYTIPLTEQSGPEVFAQMQKSGEIPEDAVYRGFDPETGAIQYDVPPEMVSLDDYKDLESLFLQLSPEEQREIAASVPNMPMLADYEVRRDELGIKRPMPIEEPHPPEFSEMNQSLQQAVVYRWAMNEGIVPTMWEQLYHEAPYMVPFYGTYKESQRSGVLSPWTAFSALTDLWLASQLLHAAAAEARASAAITRTGRLKASARGAWKSITAFPTSVSDVKASIKDPVIQVADRLQKGFIPVSGLERSYSTLRIPVAIAGSADEALAVKEALMTKIVNGETPKVVYNGVTYSAAKGGLVHTTPDAKFLLEGGTVGFKARNPKGEIEIFNSLDEVPKGYKLMPESEQGLFLSPSTHTRFIGTSAFGRTGETPAVGMFSTVRQVQTGKLYKQMAELERKIAAGEIIEPRRTVGFTRTATGVKFLVLSDADVPILHRILVRIGEPLSEVRSLYTPALRISGKTVDEIDLLEEALRFDEAARLADEAGQAGKAAKFRAEAVSLREEVLSRPLTRNAAGEFYVQFTGAAYALRAQYEEILAGGNREAAEAVLRASESMQELADFYDRLSHDDQLRGYYNKYVMLPNRDKMELARMGISGVDIARALDYARDRAPAGWRPNFEVLSLRSRTDYGGSRITPITGGVGRTPSPDLQVSTPRVPGVRRTEITETSRVPGTLEPTRVPSVPRIPTIPKITTIPRTQRIPRIPSVTPPEKSVLLPKDDGDTKKKRQRIPPGSVTWAQGMVWRYIPPPYNPPVPITLWAAPIGARNTDSNKPEDTIQVIGGRKGVPPVIMMDLGVEDIKITNGRKIEFTSDREFLTDVGTSLPSKTRGMSTRATSRPKRKKNSSGGSTTLLQPRRY